MDGTTNVGIQVHRIDEIYIGIFDGKVAHSGKHSNKAIAKVLTSVASDENEFLAVGKSCYIISSFKKDFVLLFSKGGVVLQLIHYHMEGIDNGIASDIDIAMSFLLLQVLLRERRWREVIGSNTTRNLAVHLFRPWAIYIMCAKSCLHVSYWNLCIEGGKGGSGRSCGISVNKYNIRLALFEHITHTVKDADSHIGQVLTLLHDIQVNIWLDIKYLEHLVEHFTMLTCYAHDGFKLFCPLLEFLNQRTHLNSFGTSTEDKHYCFHIVIF